MIPPNISCHIWEMRTPSQLRINPNSRGLVEIRVVTKAREGVHGVGHQKSDRLDEGFEETEPIALLPGESLSSSGEWRSARSRRRVRGLGRQGRWNRGRCAHPTILLVSERAITAPAEIRLRPLHPLCRRSRYTLFSRSPCSSGCRGGTSSCRAALSYRARTFGPQRRRPKA